MVQSTCFTLASSRRYHHSILNRVEETSAPAKRNLQQIPLSFQQRTSRTRTSQFITAPSPRPVSQSSQIAIPTSDLLPNVDVHSPNAHCQRKKATSRMAAVQLTGSSAGASFSIAVKSNTAYNIGRQKAVVSSRPSPRHKSVPPFSVNLSATSSKAVLSSCHNNVLSQSPYFPKQLRAPLNVAQTPNPSTLCNAPRRISSNVLRSGSDSPTRDSIQAVRSCDLWKKNTVTLQDSCHVCGRSLKVGLAITYYYHPYRSDEPMCFECSSSRRSCCCCESRKNVVTVEGFNICHKCRTLGGVRSTVQAKHVQMRVVQFLREVVGRRFGLCADVKVVPQSVICSPESGDNHSSKLNSTVYGICHCVTSGRGRRFVEEVQVLNALPPSLFGGFLAHELVHAFLHLNGIEFRGNESDFEEGLCNVAMVLWMRYQRKNLTDLAERVQSQIKTGKANSFDEHTSCSNSRNAVAVARKATAEANILSFWLRKLENTDHPLYGKAWRKAYSQIQRDGWGKAMKNISLD